MKLCTPIDIPKDCTLCLIKPHVLKGILSEDFCRKISFPSTKNENWYNTLITESTLSKIVLFSEIIDIMVVGIISPNFFYIH